MCSLKRHGDLFILTITGDDEHRLNPTLMNSIRAALHQVKSEAATRSTALITTAHGNYFSNGYDLAWALSDPDPVPTRPKILSKKLRLLVEDLISLPMPTIAAVNGHASAAGFIFALSHDYILMRECRGYLYMNELQIGLKIPSWVSQVLKSRIGAPKILKNILLKTTKINARSGLEWGIVDSAHANTAEMVDAAVELATDLVSRKWDGEVYAANRKLCLPTCWQALSPMRRWGITSSQNCDLS